VDPDDLERNTHKKQHCLVRYTQVRVPTCRIEKLRDGSSLSVAPYAQESALFTQVNTGASSHQS
jgi:hypothetical protein